jgi:hypothetical protein
MGIVPWKFPFVGAKPFDLAMTEAEIADQQMFTEPPQPPEPPGTNARFTKM